MSVILDSLPVNPLPWLPEISHSPIWMEPHFQSATPVSELARTEQLAIVKKVSRRQ